MPTRRRVLAALPAPRTAVTAAGLVAATLAAALPSTVAAQAASAAGSGPPVDAPAGADAHFVVGGGAEVYGREGSRNPPQIALHLGYQLAGAQRVGAPRAGLRLGVDFAARDVEPARGGVGPDFDARRSRSLGLVLLGTYALARGPVRPYLVGGAGVYRVWSATTYRSSVLLPPDYAPTPSSTVRADALPLGLTAGGGLSALVGRVVLFGEARLTVLPAAGFSETPGLRGTLLPLVLGARF